MLSTLTLAEGDIAKVATLVRDLADVPPVRMPASRIGQVVLNLILNALDAMRGAPGPHELVVRLRPDGDRVQLSVKDSGCGIPPELLGRIFEPFFTTKDAGQGTGLGLTIAQRIVVEEGGTIAVASEPGKGAELHVWLPVAAPRADATPG